jgi:UDP-N-acetylmuramoylalanine--D-glutamate ligase
MKKLVVLGGGESGCGAAVLGQQKGYEVFLSDRGKIKKKYKDVLTQFEIEWEEEKHTEELIFAADEVVKSPGIPDGIPLIQELRARGVVVMSEIEFAARYTDAKTIAITGSNGKTTTTMLLGHMFKKAGVNVGVAGNVGDSFAMQVATQEHEVYILELSSFQLDGIIDFKPDVAILLNITPDHLDRYDNSMLKYIQSKFRISMNQDEQTHFIYCADDPNIQEHIGGVNAQKWPFSIQRELQRGAFLKEDEILINTDIEPFIMNIQQLALQGKHNIYNSMASAIAGRIFDLRKDVIRESLIDFKNVEHRLERVIKVHGIEFINDSKATNVNSVWYALESMTKPTVWIVGGVDKGNDYQALAALVEEKVKVIICLGEDVARIHQAFEGKVEVMANAASMSEAVKLAYHHGYKGDAVLLSPACASFDLFDNYEHRGHEFKKAVRNL